MITMAAKRAEDRVARLRRVLQEKEEALARQRDHLEAETQRTQEENARISRERGYRSAVTPPSGSFVREAERDVEIARRDLEGALAESAALQAAESVSPAGIAADTTRARKRVDQLVGAGSKIEGKLAEATRKLEAVREKRDEAIGSADDVDAKQAAAERFSAKEHALADVVRSLERDLGETRKQEAEARVEVERLEVLARHEAAKALLPAVTRAWAKAADALLAYAKAIAEIEAAEAEVQRAFGALGVRDVVPDRPDGWGDLPHALRDRLVTDMQDARTFRALSEIAGAPGK